MNDFITIKVRNNNKFQCTGNIKLLNKLQKNMTIRHPNAFFIRQKTNWDGNIKYLTDSGYVASGLLQHVLNLCDDLDIDYELEDYRDDIAIPTVPTKIGNMVLRKYQFEAVSSIVNNTIDGLPYPIGIINTATNSGKTLMSVAIHKSYGDRYNTIILINSGDLYNQMLTEIPAIIGEKDFGYIRGKDFKLGRVTLAMVQTLYSNIEVVKHELSSYFQIALVDECDLADNKTYKTILKYLINTKVKCGLSGSVYVSDLKKHLVQNMNIRSFFGEELYKVTKKEMVDKGHSSNLKIKILQGNTRVITDLPYDEEYRIGISTNEARGLVSIERALVNIGLKRYPILVVCRYHEHVENLYKQFISDKRFRKYKICFVHHKIKDRKEIIDRFRAGEITILISSLIIKRGQNFPRLRVLHNASGGKKDENVMQLMGRAERKNLNKKIKTNYIEDFMDEGKHLKRHSNGRIRRYKKEGFKVSKLF